MSDDDEPLFGSFTVFGGVVHDTIGWADGTLTSETWKDGELVDASIEGPRPWPEPPQGQVWAHEAGLPNCRVYWGSHGCHLPRGHDGHHHCDCCECPNHSEGNVDDEGVMCVATFPYYGADTYFYGEDAPA